MITQDTAQLRTWTSGSEAGEYWQGEHPDLRVEAMYLGGDEDENM